MPFEIGDTSLAPVKRVTAIRFDDERGWFMEAYHERALQTIGAGSVAQVNHAFSRRAGTVRGLHYQNQPAEQGKLVRCLRGAIMDVAVDLRRGATQGQWVIEKLETPEQMLWVPAGFAHGFQTLVPDTEVEYVVTGAPYQPEAEGAIRWNDPTLAIPWPLEAITSSRDAAAPLWPGRADS